MLGYCIQFAYQPFVSIVSWTFKRDQIFYQPLITNFQNLNYQSLNEVIIDKQKRQKIIIEGLLTKFHNLTIFKVKGFQVDWMGVKGTGERGFCVFSCRPGVRNLWFGPGLRECAFPGCCAVGWSGVVVVEWRGIVCMKGVNLF